MLDVGCGTRSYERLLPAMEYGLELDTPENRRTKLPDVYYHGHGLPFPDGSFDGVISNEALEHVFEPEAFMGEIACVLTPRRPPCCVWFRSCGTSTSSPRTTALLLVRGGGAVGEALCRNSQSAQDRGQRGNDLPACQCISLYKITVTRNLYVNVGTTLLLMAPFNLLGALLVWIMRGNPDLAERRMLAPAVNEFR